MRRRGTPLHFSVIIPVKLADFRLFSSFVSFLAKQSVMDG
jgi:hypothetical protein